MDIPTVKKVSVEKLEAMDQQQRRASMQGRRLSLVEVIPDWPSLKHAEKEPEVQLIIGNQVFYTKFKPSSKHVAHKLSDVSL